MRANGKPQRRYLDALRACALDPQGLRYSAYPSIMPALLKLGYVEERAPQERPWEKRWHLTSAGRELLKAVGTGEPREG